MKLLNLNTWNRKQLYYHFKDFKDPYFALTVPFDVTKSYNYSKANEISFFGKYLHDCMKAINSVDNLRYRIVGEDVIDYNVIHASPTISRKNGTYGFSFVKYDDSLQQFLKNLLKEKERVEHDTELYPKEEERLDCIHCSAIPWVNFISQKEPQSGRPDSVPKLSFSKVVKEGKKRIMNVSIAVNHALADGYHIGVFVEEFQNNLNQLDIK